jgi:DNA-binding transcriptional LysR family regulator
MNLSLVRVQRFVAVAEQLSFTRAAALLGIDQPWLSRQIMQLEDQLGIMLFDRSGSRIALTPEGREFFEVAQQIDIAAQKVREKAEEMMRRSQSALRVCVAYATFPIEGRNSLLNRYAAIRPDVGVDYSATEWSDDVVNKVKSGEADFGIAFGPVEDPDIEVCELERIEMTLAVPQESTLASMTSVALSDLQNHRIAVAMKDPKASSLVNRYSWIEEVGAIPVHVPEGRRYIFDVAERERTGVICYTTAEKLPEGFVRRPIHGDVPQFNLILIRCKRIMSPAAERFWRLGQELSSESQSAA